MKSLLMTVVVTTVAIVVGCVGCSKLPGGSSYPPGWVTAYKPVTYYDRIRRDCGPGCKLLKLRAKNVRSDGTMDLTATALAEYEFRNMKGKTKGTKKSSSSGSGKYEKVIITVPRIGGSRRMDKMSVGRTTRSFNIKANRGTTVIAPRCSMADLWKAALTKGADQKALATVVYDRHGYVFKIKEKNFELTFDTKCQASQVSTTEVRPVADFASVASMVPKEAEFLELTAREVRSDGTADTTSDPAWVRYRFFRTRPLKPTEEVEILLRGGKVKKSRKDMTLGTKPKGVPPPTCKFSELWRIALENKADKGQPARITYEGKGYSFRQESPRLTLEFDTACKLKR